MDNQTDPDFLANEAYSDAAALDTRIRIQDLYRSHPQNWFRWLFDHFQNLPPACLMLELGSGPGDLWQKNADRIPLGWRVYLSDLSVGMAVEAVRRLKPVGLSYQALGVNAQSLPFPNEGFDVVIGNGLLDHLPELDNALDEIQRVLKPGGLFYTSTGGRGHLWEIESLVKPFLPEADYGGDPTRFGLENGAERLSGWFGNIRRSDYQDELVFKTAEPIIAYVRSEAIVQAALQGSKLAAFIQFVENELAVRGEIRVTSEKGVFTAQRAGEAAQTL